ncbi:MAG: hypothetical protein OK436_03850 [Thaumarchaeota archaeon]|nr:hypothetical protein [Nitrososphaerota archaeon]
MVTAALIVGLLIGAGVIYTLAGASLGRTITATTTSPAVTNTTTVTVSQTSQAVAAFASNGLRLSTSINATKLTMGQKLNISISLFNTLPTPNAFWGLNVAPSPSGQARNWTFYGVQVATWPECTLQLPFGWPFPIEVLVLKGNYTAQELSSSATVPFSFNCGASAFPRFAFGPNSDLVNITYLASGVGNKPVGLYRLSSNLVVSGYWNLTSLAEQASSSPICVPAVSHACGLPAFTPFAPGVYTVGVTDEWGQFNVLHFQVSGSG